MMNILSIIPACLLACRCHLAKGTTVHPHSFLHRLGKLCQLCSISRSMWHTIVSVFTCRVVYISHSRKLLRSLFVMLSLHASMHTARLVVCLLFVRVGRVLCLLRGSLRRTPLWLNNHGNSKSRFACLFCLLFICSTFFPPILFSLPFSRVKTEMF